MNGSKVVDPVDKHFEPNLYHVFYVLVYAILNHSLLGELSVMLLVNGGEDLDLLVRVLQDPRV